MINCKDLQRPLTQYTPGSNSLFQILSETQAVMYYPDKQMKNVFDNVLTPHLC